MTTSEDLQISGQTFASFPIRMAAGVVIAMSLFVWWIGHPATVIDIVGDGPAALVRRQSEGYVMIALLIGFWAWLAPNGHPSAPDVEVPRNPTTSMASWVLWFGSLTVVTILMSATEVLPNYLVTLKEATVGVIVVSGYLAWSRGLSRKTWSSGAPVQPAPIRVTYYAVMAAIIVFTYGGAFDVLGEGLSLWFKENSEAFGAVLLIPLYFDVVARRPGVASRVAYYGGVVALLVLAQISGFPDAIQPFAGWLNEMTEAFIAALAIAIFFDALTPKTDRVTS